MDLERHRSMEEVRAFVASTAPGAALKAGREEAYGHIGRTLRRFAYWRLGKAQKGLLKRYLERSTGLSRAQVGRLVKRYLEAGELADRRRGSAQPFRKRYTREDIVLLAETDELHGRLSGPATLALLRRAWEVFGDARYARLAGLSNGYLYNLRQTPAYVRRMGRKTTTRAAQAAPIGERRKPLAQGRPGYLRVDSVHQGDLHKVKGVYHLNAVDEVTQYQFVGTVERISERYLLPVLERLLAAFPFVICGFHSDNGSEYVNYQVAALLEKLRVEFTRSRPRRSNDNALAESKNGTVVRKQLGYGHIPGKHAAQLDRFNRELLSPYLNYHRPCYFAHTRIDAKGRQRKLYRQADLQTPYEKLKSLPAAASYLRPGGSFAALDQQAYAQSDHEAAQALHAARDALFAQLRSAALLGAAPCANDSGQHEGRRRIRSGRRAPRERMYMAAVAALRWNPPLRAFYDRLRARGKQAKVALVAVMRKRIVLADALLRADRLWQPAPHTREAPA